MMGLPRIAIACAVMTAFTGYASAHLNATHVNAEGFKYVLPAQRPLRILISNDDSWASGHVRAFRYALETAGHDVVLVAPVMDESGKGGTFSIPNEPTLPRAGRYNAVKAATVLWGLDTVVQNTFGGGKVDLVVTGPNEGLNLGPFKFTKSGTIGASYAAVERGIPSIAFSADTRAKDYSLVHYTDPHDVPIRIATLSANVVTEFANQLVTNPGKRLLPVGIGASVNIAKSSTYISECKNVHFYRSRLTGNATTHKLAVDTQTNLPTYHDIKTDAINFCWNGPCNLQGETTIIKERKCSATISLYSTDYTAPIPADGDLETNLETIIANLNRQDNPIEEENDSLQLVFAAPQSL